MILCYACQLVSFTSHFNSKRSSFIIIFEMMKISIFVVVLVLSCVVELLAQNTVPCYSQSGSCGSGCGNCACLNGICYWCPYGYCSLDLLPTCICSSTSPISTSTASTSSSGFSSSTSWSATSGYTGNAATSGSTNTGPISCSYFNDSKCILPFPGFQETHYTVGVCNPTTFPSTEVTVVNGNEVTVCFYNDPQCTSVSNCVTGDAGECVKIVETYAYTIYGKCEWAVENYWKDHWYIIAVPLVVVVGIVMAIGVCVYRRRQRSRYEQVTN